MNYWKRNLSKMLKAKRLMLKHCGYMIINKSHRPSPQGLSPEDPAHANAFTPMHKTENNYI